MEQMMGFIEELYKLSNDKVAKYSLASEACLSVNELILQIQSREKKLSDIAQVNIMLKDFLEKEFKPTKEMVLKQLFEMEPPRVLNKKLPRKYQTLSPSDFGYHNALRTTNGQLVFLDFEYFGWDDPVKLIADFVWHPAMKLDETKINYWIAGCLNIFQNDLDLKQRLRYCWPLYGLRWVMILLNEFKEDGWNKRIHANNIKMSQRNEHLNSQIKKATYILDKLNNNSIEYFLA
jgi:hypothetical protein